MAKNTPETPATAVRTPENTPVPGGGRWRWDIAAPGWVDLDAPPADALPATPLANPTQPE